MHHVSARQLAETASLSKGWRFQKWNDCECLAAVFGGNELRFRIEAPAPVRIQVVTQPYVFAHVEQDGSHIARVEPEKEPGVVELTPAPGGSEMRVLRTAVSSGPFYVDAMIAGLESKDSIRLAAPSAPVPSTVFCTFGDSISGNCCISPPGGPFDPYKIGYGYAICDRFGWQYLNSARDGSGVCCTPFDNPLAGDRLDRDLLVWRPDYLHVFYGTNDIRSGVPVERFADSLHVLLARIARGLPDTRITVSGLHWNDMASDDDLAAYNRAIQHAATILGIPFCSIHEELTRTLIEDGVHPNEAGQRLLATIFGNFLAETWPELREKATC